MFPLLGPSGGPLEAILEVPQVHPGRPGGLQEVGALAFGIPFQTQSDPDFGMLFPQKTALDFGMPVQKHSATAYKMLFQKRAVPTNTQPLDA